MKSEKQVETKIIWCLEMAQMKLVKVEKGVEMKMIQCLEMALYQTCESREARRNLDNLMP